VVWNHGKLAVLGTLGGINSGGFGAIEQRGEILTVGQAESADADPNDENFCFYGTHEKCLPVLWNGSTVTQLPTLGGTNGSSGPINAKGEVAGTAETAFRDPACPGIVAVNGTGPQVLDYKGVIWDLNRNQTRTLEPLAGDTVSIALWINDEGEAVGISGTCANTVIPPIAYGPHSVLWDRRGIPHDLGNLGSATANAALSINNRGDVVGASSTTGASNAFDGSFAFLWIREQDIRSLGALPGDVASAAQGINDKGEITGLSVDPQGNPRAVLWRQGLIADLNELTVEDSPLSILLDAYSTNDAGEVVGFGVTTLGDIHGFLLTPCDRSDEAWNPEMHRNRQATLPPYLRDIVRARLGMHHQ
jgi:uncharacterized membrane protein